MILTSIALFLQSAWLTLTVIEYIHFPSPLYIYLDLQPSKPRPLYIVPFFLCFGAAFIPSGLNGVRLVTRILCFISLLNIFLFSCGRRYSLAGYLVVHISPHYLFLSKHVHYKPL